MLFEWCSRIGVNESRAAGAESWHCSIDSGNELSLKTTACCNERFTYKASGEVSRFSILHPNTKRLFPSRGPSRSVFRSQFGRLCQNCKKNIRSSNSSSPNARDEVPTKSAKRCFSSDDFNGDAKSVSSSKRRRLDEMTKNGHVKLRNFDHIESFPVQKKDVESKQGLPFSLSPSSKKMKGDLTKAISTSKESSRSLICAEHNAESGILHVRTTSHEKSRRRDRQAAVTDKSVEVAESQHQKSSTVPAKPERKNLPPEPQHRPPIKIKINRSLLLGNGDPNSNKGSGKAEIVSGYKVEVLPNESGSLADDSTTLQGPISPSPVADSASSSYSPLAYDPLAVTEGNLVEKYQLPSNPSITFRVGDVVWGKLSGWPWWPARITRLCLRPPSSFCGAQVIWFGTNETNEFSCEKILPFLANYEKKLDRRKLKQKQKMYKKAVEEALALAQAQSSVNDRDIEKGDVTLNNADVMTPAFASEAEPDDPGGDFDGNGPLMIDHIPPPSNSLENSDMILLSSSTTSTLS
ncbi:hypothetical protein Aperf_G00000042725 [Anoplocephala perfoliata]